MLSSRLTTVVLAGALALVLAGGAGLWYLFLRDAGPAPVSVPSASSAATAPTIGSGGSASPAGTAAATLDGTWNVDDSGSFVGYRVQEQLVGIGANTAVGRTSAVTGTVTFQGTQVTAIDMTADLTQLQSDSQQRDGQLQNQGIQTGQYPKATFKLTAPIELGSVPAQGQTVSATATGDLTIHGTTKSVQIPVKAQLSGGTVTVIGSIDIVFADYGFTGPSSFKVLSVQDHGTMEFQLLLRHA
jgi:polyisoprenoid-binding protein YceI